MRFGAVLLIVVFGACFDFDHAYARYCDATRCVGDGGISSNEEMTGGGSGGGDTISSAGGGSGGGTTSGAGGGIQAGQDCSLPWGGRISSGTAITAFSNPLATKPSCSVSVTPETYVINGAERHRVFMDSDVCMREVRTCANGVLDGALTNRDCLGCEWRLDNLSFVSSICMPKSNVFDPASGMAYMANEILVVQVSSGANLANQQQTSATGQHTLTFHAQAPGGLTECSTTFSLP